MHKPRWSNLEYVLAVAREGSIAAAARRMNVSHTTVMRRVRSFENSLNEPIFEHRPTGYRLTRRGEVFLEAAQVIEATLADLDRKIAGRDDRLRGNICITTTDSILPELISDIATFHAQYPDITLDLSVTNARLDLFKRDADIAIRPSQHPPPDLVGRRTGVLKFGAYVAPELLPVTGAEKIADVPWLGMEEPLASSVPGKWLNEAVAGSSITMRTDSFITLSGLAEAGLGCTILPRHVGDPSVKLTRVFADKVDLGADLWVLVHRDVLRSQRVKVCADFFVNALKAKAAVFSGK